MKWLKRVVLLLAFTMLSCPFPVWAHEMVIVGSNSKPPKYWTEKGRSKGILVDMVLYVGREMGYTFNVELYPWARAYRHAYEGKAAIIGLSKNYDRLKIFDYSDVMYYDDVLLVVKKGNEFPFEKMEDLKGKRIANSRGASFGDAFDTAAKNIFTTHFTDDNIQRLKLFLSGRVDAAITGPGKIGFLMTFAQDPKLLEARDQFVLLSHPVVRDPNYLGISKELKARGFLKKFNRALKKGHESGAFQEIVETYYENFRDEPGEQ